MDAVPLFLDAADPAPVEIVGPRAPRPLVLTCEHGGRALPARLAGRAPGAEDLARHIAWDVGAAGVARGLADRLGAALCLQRYSRLVIDCNRPRHAPDLMPAVSDGTEVPFNARIDESERDARWEAIHAPFHAAVADLLDARPGAALVAVHSFTPRLRGGAPRPMLAGLLVRRDRTLADALMRALAARTPEGAVVFNQPYAIEDDSDYTIPVHGERRGLPHVLVEIRSDQIADPAGVARWTALLADALAAATGDRAWISTA
jgi:predicted N-formylglutamate amidohydrolase